ncbi:Sorting nexin [Strongyloides ratti]|uniref:Sorting nexin n=1 Tax=Strongyloides ratti TaxID=34506 RepID=A0A090MPZ8_STRRB|nr:Sorting nexin [Strongyloides ratti]CEF60187.1 Sorting nexin [Strongyloides ratti]
MSQVRACYDFDAQPGSGELSIKENEILTVIREKIEGGWMEGRNSEGKHGLFPESYVVKIQPLTTTAISSPVQLPSVPVQELPAPPSLYDSSWENPSIAAPLPQSLPTIYPNLQNLSQTQPQNNSQILPTTRPQVFQNTSNNDTNNQYDDFYDEWTDEEDDTGDNAPGSSNLGVNSSMNRLAVSRSKSAGTDVTGGTNKQGTAKMKQINRFSNFVKSGMESYILGQSKVEYRPRYSIVKKGDTIEWVREKPFIDITVEDPKKESKLKGLKSYIAYQLTNSANNGHVSRRYKHFDWLHEQLSTKYLLIPIPPLPEKQVSGRYEEDLIEHRKNILQLWVKKICAHPILSSSDVWNHFIFCNDEKEWKAGKRLSERDEYVGGNFFMNLAVPDQVINLADLDRQTELFTRSSKFIDESIKILYDKLFETQKRMAGPYKANFKKLSDAFDALYIAFEVDTSQKNRSLSTAIKESSRILSKIGDDHEIHAKKNIEITLDWLYTYKGILSSIPDIINVHKSCLNKMKENERLLDEGKVTTHQAKMVQRHVDTTSYALLAEINHLTNERTKDFSHMLELFFSQQAEFYKNIGQQFETLSKKFKK